ncbi:MAG: hypothetical protein ACRC8W_00600 [Plesiomonas shigelloides]
MTMRVLTDMPTCGKFVMITEYPDGNVATNIMMVNSGKLHYWNAFCEIYKECPDDFNDDDAVSELYIVIE